MAEKEESSFSSDGFIEINLPSIINVWEKPASKPKPPIAAKNKLSDKAPVTPKTGEPNGETNSSNG